MSDYTKTTSFGVKDSLSTGDPNKIVLGSELDTEFDNIATASATKYDASTGTLQFNQINDSNGNEMVTFSTAAGAVNHLRVINSSGTEPKLLVAGDDTNIDLVIGPKGDGLVKTSQTTLSGVNQGIYVGLDTPVSLVSNTSTSSTNWTTVNNATLNSAAPAIAKLRIQTKAGSTSASTASCVVDIASSGQSGAISSTLNAPTVYTAHMNYSESTTAGTAGYAVTEVDVNLDGSYDFQYGTSVGAGATSVYVNIILVGYYV